VKRTLSVAISFGVVVCFAASALGQAGAPTQRVHIPGIPDRTSIYPKSMDRGDNFVSIGCVAKSPDGEFLITDYRGGERPPVAGAPSFAARAPLVFRLQGDQEMLNFQVGHEVQITGQIVEKADASRPPGMKVDSILYLSRICWERGTTTAEHAKPKP
jgi:hypothetical protein